MERAQIIKEGNWNHKVTKTLRTCNETLTAKIFDRRGAETQRKHVFFARLLKAGFPLRLCVSAVKGVLLQPLKNQASPLKIVFPAVEVVENKLFLASLRATLSKPSASKGLAVNFQTFPKVESRGGYLRMAGRFARGGRREPKG